MEINVPVNSVDKIIIAVIILLIVLAVFRIVGFFHEKK